MFTSSDLAAQFRHRHIKRLVVSRAAVVVNAVTVVGAHPQVTVHDVRVATGVQWCHSPRVGDPVRIESVQAIHNVFHLAIVHASHARKATLLSLAVNQWQTS